MEANEYQIDGDHYAGVYQHWDFAIDNELDFMLGTALKYLARYGKKEEDKDTKGLRKTLHYIAKATEECIFNPTPNRHYWLMKNKPIYEKYFSGLDSPIQMMTMLILNNEFKRLSSYLSQFISDEELKSKRLIT